MLERTPSLDETALAKLREMDIESMHSASLRQDGVALRMTAHSIKSSSAYLGALRMCDLCKELEILGWESRLEAAKTVLAELQAEYVRVESELHKLIQA